MDAVQKEMIDSVSSSTSRDILHFCIKKLLRGSGKDFEQDERAKINECLNNFTYSYVIVADSWTKVLNETLRNEG
jgi:hypothetical protein